MNTTGYLKVLTICLAALALSGCVSQTVKSTSVPPLNNPSQAIPDAELLDVGVAVFDPNIATIDESADVPVYPEVRKAEARFMAHELSKTLQESGAWGAVRVVPDTQQFTDLLVAASISRSDGEQLMLDVKVTDARGKVWIDKVYSGVTSRYAYDQATRTRQDPFTLVYRQIANDLLKAFETLSSRERIAIRQVAELRFAREFASDAFADYLVQNSEGIYKIQRLPAENDPMLERLRNIRQRQYVFVDTLQGYYSGFAEDMYVPYQEWRKLGYEEVVAQRELQTQARNQMIAGGVAILAGIAAQGSSSDYTRAAGTVGILGGAAILKGGLEKRNEANIHTLALEEIGQSLQAEITPRVIELDDRTVRLSGNVEDQYDQWRELMADIYAAEMGALSSPLPVEQEPLEQEPLEQEPLKIDPASDNDAGAALDVQATDDKVTAATLR